MEQDFNYESFMDYMSSGKAHKDMAERYKARDERILARLNYKEALQWFKKAILLVRDWEKQSNEEDLSAYISNAEWEYQYCANQLNELKGSYLLNNL